MDAPHPSQGMETLRGSTLMRLCCLCHADEGSICGRVLDDCFADVYRYFDFAQTSC